TGMCTSGSPCTVPNNSSLNLTAATNAGFRFVRWDGENCVDSVPATANVVDLVSITTDVTCTAVFTPRFNVDFPNPTNGSVAASNVPPTATCTGTRCTVDQGASLTLTATADAGFRFTAWSNCSASTNPALALSAISQNLTCVANF